MKTFNIELDMGGFVARVEGQCSAGYPAKTNCPVEEGYEGKADEIVVDLVHIQDEEGEICFVLFTDQTSEFAERYASQIKDALIDGGYL